MKTRVFIDDGYPESQEYNDNYRFVTEAYVVEQLHGQQGSGPDRERGCATPPAPQRWLRSEVRDREPATHDLSMAALLKRTWDGWAARLRYALHG